MREEQLRVGKFCTNNRSMGALHSFPTTPQCFQISIMNLEKERLSTTGLIQVGLFASSMFISFSYRSDAALAHEQ